MVCPLRPPCLAPTCPYRYPLQDGADWGSGDVCSAGKEPWHAIHPLANVRVRCPYRPVPRRQQTRDPHWIGDCTAAAGEKKRKDAEEEEKKEEERIYEDEEVEGEEEEKKILIQFFFTL